MIAGSIPRCGRIACRATTAADLDFVLEMERGAENAPFIRQWPPAQHRAAIADPNIAHLIVQEIASQRIIGYVILIGLENPDLNLEFKRIVIADKGNGFGRETVHLIKEYAFEQLNMHRLWLEVMEKNTRAFALYQSEGFVVEGTHREAVKQADVFTSLTVMSLLAPEYKSA